MEKRTREIHRLSRVVDMMTTMHAVLAQRYKRRALLMDILLLAAATVVAALTFADLTDLSPFGLPALVADAAVGLASVAVFFFSVVALVVDWKGVSGRHKEAFDALLGLKADLREARGKLDAMSAEEISSLVKKATLVMSRFIEIPDHQFNYLKSIHHRKMAVSRMLTDHPGASSRLVAVRIWLAANRRVLSASVSTFGPIDTAPPDPTSPSTPPRASRPHDASSDPT